MNRVLVVGSINMDLVAGVGRFPAPGETLAGSGFATYHGGKGANQAVAAARLGAAVTMIGCVGDDAFGGELLAELAREGVDTRHVRRCAGTPSGVAVITVCPPENTIVVIPGANHALTPADVLAAEAEFAAADVVLSQLEVPLAVVEAAAELAARHGKPFLLNPAPAVPLPATLLNRTTLLTPNEHELAILFPEAGGDWRQALTDRPGRVVMTHGSEGAWTAGADGSLRRQPSFPVEAVDTTGAGDTFNAALAAAWGGDFADGLRFACAAAALSVTRPGARGGMPTRAAVNGLLK